MKKTYSCGCGNAIESGGIATTARGDKAGSYASGAIWESNGKQQFGEIKTILHLSND